MKKYFTRFLLTALLIFTAAPAFAQVPSITGVYQAIGTNPGNRGSYKGTATISPEGDHYRVKWAVGTSYEGVGYLRGNTFTVEWGTAAAHVGTVTYAVQPNGVMTGTWFVAKDPTNLGTEILTPKK